MIRIHPQGIHHYNIKQDDYGQSHGGPSYSRDFALPTIPCEVSCCPSNQTGKCQMPSLIQISPDGSCRFGKVALATYGQKPRKVDGD